MAIITPPAISQARAAAAAFRAAIGVAGVRGTANQLATLAGNAVEVAGTLTCASTNLIMLGASFTAADVGKTILVPGIGSGGVPSQRTISAVGSATSITLSSGPTVGVAVLPCTLAYGTDDSAAIQTAHDLAYADGARNLWFEKGAYFAPNLTACGQLPFVGDGTSRLVGAYRKRIVPSYAPSARMPRRTLTPSRHMAAFLAASSPVVVLTGDSIMTTGADGIAAGEQQQSIIMRALVEQYPAKTITFYNRAASGAQWFMLDSNLVGLTGKPSYYAAYTDNWITTYIQPLAPDLIIVAMGMNGSVGNVETNAASMLSVVTKFKAFTKVPDIVFVTPMVPTTMVATFREQDAQEAREQQASLMRGYALRTNLGFIDLNRWINEARDGRRILSGVLRRRLTNVGWAAAGGTGKYPNPCLDFSLNAQVQSGSFAAFQAGSKLRFRIGSTTANYVEVGVASGFFTFAVQTYAGVYSVATFTSALPSNGTTATIELVVVGNRIECRVATVAAVQTQGDLLFSGYVERIGGLMIPTFTCSGTDVQLFLSTFCTTDIPQVMPLINDAAFWGDYPSDVNGGYNTTTGGNGVNHPSDEAINQVLAPLFEYELGT